MLRNYMIPTLPDNGTREWLSCPLLIWSWRMLVPYIPSMSMMVIVSPGIEHGYIVFPSHKNNVNI